MSENDYDYKVTNSWDEMLHHFLTTVWPDFQRAGFTNKQFVLQLFFFNRMYNMLDIHLEKISEALDEMVQSQ